GDYPGFASRIMDENGDLRRFVNIYLNDEDVRYLGGKDTPIKDGDAVSFLPALAGGI
ncbi:MAG: MoaD/ThiS family protein, partial [Dehalococcoidia bacterium]